MMTIKVGIIGCGGIANGKHMPSLQKVENVEMTAFCDVDISKAACAAEAYGTDNAKVYDDYKALLKDDTIDVIHVCTPNDSHCEITVAGLHAGKHVMCEKPMAKTTAEAQGGGPLIDIGTHALDLTLWMMDNYEPESVMGSTFHKLNKQHDAANAWGSWNPDEFTVEDSAFGFIKMKNGATIILESAWAINSLEVDEAKCSLSGTKAGADMKDGLRIHGEDMGTLYTKHVELENKGVDFYEGNEVDEAEEEAKAWIDAVVNDTEPVVKPEQAMVVTKILEAIYQSAKSGKAIYFE